VRLQLLLGSFRYTPVGLLDETHLRFFTLASFNEMAWTCGFAPIGVTRVDPRTAQYELTANALNTNKPSSFSSRQLLNLDLYDLFNDDPKAALAKLHQGLVPTGDEDRVFALAESLGAP